MQGATVNMRFAALTETYLDCRSKVQMTAKKFVKRYKTDYEETLAEADLLFIRAYDTYDDSMGAAFSTWIYTKIWYGLKETLRSKIDKASRRPSHLSYTEDVLTGPDGNRFDLLDYIEDLEADPKDVVRTLFLRPEVWQEGMEEQNKGSPYFIRSALVRCFKKRKWPPARIAAAFAAVEQSLETK
jgi:hypothetical protein